jgi:hypothetical protein
MPTKLKVRVPLVGETWKDTDSRFFRTIKITNVNESVGMVWFTCNESKRDSKARLSRFHGGSGGYRFLLDKNGKGNGA